MLRTIRSLCYVLARFLGDVNAIRRGPRAMGRRVWLLVVTFCHDGRVGLVAASFAGRRVWLR
jgi:hypothetical protein